MIDSPEKLEKVELIYDLLPKVQDPLVQRFFDSDSEEFLDEKIEVLQALVKGKTPGEIPKYYDILELMPKDNEHWDL